MNLLKKILGLGVVLVVVGVGAVGYAFLRPPEEASGPIEAIPISLDEPDAAEPMVAPDTVELGPTVAPASTPAAAASESATGSAPEAGPVIFEIVQDDSEVRFIINEVLNGAPKTVVGTTDQVAGEIAINVDEPVQSKIGTILVNARTLTTDNAFRNRAIKNQILNTNAHEFVTLTPTEISGLPDSVTIGESFSFQVVGDFTVRDVTKQVTFDATVTPLSETQLEGSATTTILHADFGLTIPRARSVASVEDTVILEIDFTAVAKLG